MHGSTSWAYLGLGVALHVSAALGVRLGSGKKPKVGFEFESLIFLESQRNCGALHADFEKLKGARVKGHDHRDAAGWFMGVDTTPRSGLHPEYDLLRSLDEHDDEFDSVMNDVLDDMLSLEDKLEYELEDPPSADCKKWTAMGGRYLLQFDMQMTGPLMLEGVYDIFDMTARGEAHPLVMPREFNRRNFMTVEKTWFETNKYLRELGGRRRKRGSSVSWVTKDVLGFFSAVVSNAKAAMNMDMLDHDQGIKTLVALMPRSDWTTVYEQISHKLPKEADLWKMVQSLSCYKTENGDIAPDHAYCDFPPGNNLEEPKPRAMKHKEWGYSVRNWKVEEAGLSPEQRQEVEAIYKQRLKESRAAYRSWGSEFSSDDEEWLRAEIVKAVQPDTVYRIVTVKEWVKSMAKGKHPDAVAGYDYDNFSGSIGHFGQALEYVLGTKRAVPIWEFRALGTGFAKGLPWNAAAARKALISFHEQYPEEPK